MKNLVARIIARQSNDVLMETLDTHKNDLANWRNWGDNFLKLIAEEAHLRGLIA